MPAESQVICDPSRAATNATGEPLLRLPPNWAGLPLGLFSIPKHEEAGAARVLAPMLLLALRGHGRRWYRHGPRGTSELRTAPGMIELYGHEYEREAARWDGEAGLSVGIYLTPQVVNRLARDVPDFKLRTAHEVFDPKLRWLVQELADEAGRGAPGGALYAQGLSCALLGRLSEHYATPHAATAPAGQLGAMARQRVLDYIEAHLGDDLSVAELARLVALSPDRFAHCFKASFGMSPHRYVRQRRIETALQWLRGSTRPIAQIALELGFASQSHFTQAFREHTGRTPSAARLS